MNKSAFDLFRIMLFLNLLNLLGCTGINPLRRYEIDEQISVGKAMWWSQNPEDGDFWLGINLYPDGNRFCRYDTNRYGFALNFRTVQYVPGEIDYGVVLWVARPGSNPIPPLGEPGSLDLGWDLTQHRDFVIGGQGIEVDGSDYKPYGRFIHAQPKDSFHIGYTGIIRNVFLNLVGRDDSSKESWFAGFVNDTFQVRRAPAGDSLLWKNLFHISPSGDVGIGTSKPEGALDVSSTDGGFIVPRMTTSQRDKLKPVNGMVIYNISLNKFNFYEDGKWVVK